MVNHRYSGESGADEREQRPLGIPTVKDRVVQMAALLVLGPICEADFHPHSSGFRPGRNAHQALDQSVDALRSGRLEVVDADLSKYFDTRRNTACGHCRRKLRGNIRE